MKKGYKMMFKLLNTVTNILLLLRKQIDLWRE